MNEYLRQSFEAFSGIDMDNVVDYKELDFTRVQVTLQDGSRWLYNSGGTYVRRLPKDPQHLTDHEFRKEFGERLQDIMYLKCNIILEVIFILALMRKFLTIIYLHFLKIGAKLVLMYH